MFTIAAPVVSGIVATFFWAIAVLVFGGLAAYLLKRAPFIEPPYQGAAQWVILVLVVVVIAYLFWPYLPSPGR